MFPAMEGEVRHSSAGRGEGLQYALDYPKRNILVRARSVEEVRVAPRTRASSEAASAPQERVDPFPQGIQGELGGTAEAFQFSHRGGCFARIHRVRRRAF